MYRKILEICAALVALAALAAPSLASATTLRDTVSGVETMVLPGLGAKIVAESEETSRFSSPFGTVECNENILTGTVHKNDGNEIQGTIEDAWFQSNLTTEGTKCRGNGFIGNTTVTIPELTNGSVHNAHWCIRTIPGKDEWELWGNNCTTVPGTGELTFILEDSLIKCYFTKASVRGTFKTDLGTHEAVTLTMNNEIFNTETGTNHSSFCPSSSTLENMKFKLYTDVETSGWFPPAKGEPVYITNP